ncbi:hypothetical protein SAMN05216311_112148 [Chitinophaga sp. CF418]|nr:hypothetical protein SAMN05216311_112148 [Chitinophaga sp. CF418]
MRRISVFGSVIIVFFINFLSCSRVRSQSVRRIDSAYVISNDSARLAFVYKRNEEFFLNGFKMLRIPGNREVFLFTQHYYLKTGYVIWRKRSHYRAAFYSINHKLITELKNHNEREIIVENYFKIYNNMDAINSELSVPEVTSIPKLTIDLVRLSVNANTIYSINLDEVSRNGINSQPLLRLDSLARNSSMSLPEVWSH